MGRPLHKAVTDAPQKRYKQTAAFDQFLIYTHLASREYNKPGRKKDDSTQNTLLNINPEGNLLKEVKDIMDEIHIMTKIQEQQQIVMESFVKNVRLAVVPRIRRIGASGSHVSSSWDVLLSATTSNSLGEDMPPVGDDGKIREYRDRQKARRTLARADHLLKEVQERAFELNILAENTMHTSNAVGPSISACRGLAHTD